MTINPCFIRGRSFLRNLFDLLDEGSDADLMKLKTKLMNRKVLLDDPEVIAKCNEYIKNIDVELLYRQELEFVNTLKKL